MEEPRPEGGRRQGEGSWEQGRLPAAGLLASCCIGELPQGQLPPAVGQEAEQDPFEEQHSSPLPDPIAAGVAAVAVVADVVVVVAAVVVVVVAAVALLRREPPIP